MTDPPATYHLCPTCLRATPTAAGESYCPNDGTKMLTACPRCRAPILTPFGEYCSRCGEHLAG